jgi:hypothetical protein
MKLLSHSNGDHFFNLTAEQFYGLQLLWNRTLLGDKRLGFWKEHLIFPVLEQSNEWWWPTRLPDILQRHPALPKNLSLTHVGQHSNTNDVKEL